MKKLILTSKQFCFSLIFSLLMISNAVNGQSLPANIQVQLGPEQAFKSEPAGPASGTAASGAANLPLKVEVGIYFLDLAKLNVKDCEFFADFYIWYKIASECPFPWSPEAIEFSNGTIESASTMATYTLDSGKKYWFQRVKGHFRSAFNLHKYPFDTQELQVVIEDRDSAEFKLKFVADPQASADLRSWLDSSVQIPDWKITDSRLYIDTHHYQSDFGFGDGSLDSPESFYSRFNFKVELKRLFVPHLIKFIIPLLVISGMAYLVFFIHAVNFESQCAICVTSLLSAIALHISQSDALPSIGYLVVADKIFILFYVLIFFSLVQTVMANNYSQAGMAEAAAKIDYYSRALFPIALVIGCIIIYLTSFG